MSRTFAVPRCGRQACDFYINGGANCTAGGGNCSSARLLEAEPSVFHDERLILATRLIKSILELVGTGPDGREASFLRTPWGLLLAWVKHGEGAIPDDAVTADADDETLIKTLRLKLDRYAAKGAS